jgi:hypothetical protein
MGFERYKDEESGAIFLYNAQTGETRWEAQPELTPRDDVGDENGVELRTLDLESVVSLAPASVDPNTGTVVTGSKEANYDEDEDEDENEDEDDEGALLSPKIRVKKPSPKGDSTDTSSSGSPLPIMTPPPDTSWDRTNDAVLCCEPCCVRVNAFCCEGPSAVLEGFVKACVYLLLSTFLVLIGAASLNLSYFRPAAKAYFREACLFLGAAITLMIPCSATVCVYRGFSAVDDWEMQPIATLFGWVDPRRFSTFEGGDAATARNQYVFEGPSMDSWPQVDGYSPILHPPQYTKDMLCSKMFGIAIPEREHIEVQVEIENQRAQRAIRREKQLQGEGWLNVR